MPWFKVDDAIHSHPKFIDLPMSAIGVWTIAGAWCAQYLTDGLITSKQLMRIGAEDDDIEALVDAGLWDDLDEGYRFHDWDEYQPTRDAVEAERAAARERMQKRRRGKAGQFAGGSDDVRPNKQRTNAERSGEVRDSFAHPDPTRPVPTINNTHSPSALEGFDEFWSAYPKKVAKKAAQKIWQRAVKDSSPEDIINGAKRYAEYVKREKTERNFIKSPDGWLNAGRWEDEIPSNTNQPTTKNPLWDA